MVENQNGISAKIQEYLTNNLSAKFDSLCADNKIDRISDNEILSTDNEKLSELLFKDVVVLEVDEKVDLNVHFEKTHIVKLLSKNQIQIYPTKAGEYFNYLNVYKKEDGYCYSKKEFLEKAAEKISNDLGVTLKGVTPKLVSAYVKKISNINWATRVNVRKYGGLSIIEDDFED